MVDVTLRNGKSSTVTLADYQERQQCPDGDMAAAFERAQDLGAMFTDSSTSFIDVFVTRITQQHRLLSSSDNSGEPVKLYVVNAAHQ
jgi:hypothetical protein